MLGTRPGRGALRADVAATPLLILLYEADPAAIPLLILLYEAHLDLSPSHIRQGCLLSGPTPGLLALLPLYPLATTLPLTTTSAAFISIFTILGYWGGGRRRGAVGFS